MKIKVLPQGIELEGDTNKSILQICTENQIEIRSICKGVPSCAECRIKLSEGDHVCLPPSPQELNVLGNNYFLDGRRLSCQLRAFGDITIDVTEQIERIETQKKKIRGFRSPTSGSGQQRESKAKQGTLVLEAPEPSAQASAPAENSSSQQPQPRQQNNQQPRQKGHRHNNHRSKDQGGGQGQSSQRRR